MGIFQSLACNMHFKKILFSILMLSSRLHASVGYFEPWGRDSDLKVTAQPPIQEDYQLSPLAWAAEKAILLHQNVLTKADGPRSHFRPTSARYMLLAIRRQGFFKGYIMGCDRLLRENSEAWVYQTIKVGDKVFKWDPPPSK